jgi:hypothetical protein
MDKIIKFNKHSSNKKQMDDLGIEDKNGIYELPVSIFLDKFPCSNIVKLNCICMSCNTTYSLAVSDYTRKKHKNYCSICLKTKILTGPAASQYGKHHNAGKQKTEEHKMKMKGPRDNMKGHLNPNWNPNTPAFKRYKNRVHQLSNRTYYRHQLIINPCNHPRTLAGVEGGWQLDHIISVKECYKLGLSEEQASALENLQMLPWKTNLLKSTTR